MFNKIKVMFALYREKHLFLPAKLDTLQQNLFPHFSLKNHLFLDLAG